MSDSPEHADYATLVEHHPFMLNRFLPDTTLVYVNSAMATFFEANPDALIGKRWLDMVGEEERRQWHEHYAQFTPEAPRHQLINCVGGSKGDSHWVEWTNTAFFGDDGSLIFIQAVGIDVTARMEARTALEINEERYALAQQAAGFGVWEWHPERDEIVWDSQCYRMLGLLPSDKPLTFAEWQARLHPDDVECCSKAVNEQLLEGNEFIIEFRYQTASGYLWVQGRGQVFERDTSGAPLRLIGTHLDIQSLKSVQQELTRSNQELEQFAYAVSHDLRQPLRMVNSYLQLLTRELGNDLSDDAQEMIHFAREGAERMDKMILGILDYSRVGRKTSPMEWVDSRAVLDDVMGFLKPMLTESGGHVHIKGDWPEVYASRDELTRLLQNLLDNALKYVENGTTPDVTITGHKQTYEWQVDVQDNGIGIAPEQQDRLFGVFARLQPRSRFEGTGIGLAICKRVVEHHEGKIHVTSPGEGDGSCFTFTLPIMRHYLNTSELDTSDSAL
ncbi:sensor histidine kinase [Vreelandella arcis]|uniref:histidine kinase n=1 Tax=Vreelandella arcis TaxID=416873 RepID=A0A1G9X140_9GAMM|nr:ATP-binding protein [Halomonas arcis]SDM90504.1 PAS domain S-box-containing protein [Halomonas arcis]